MMKTIFKKELRGYFNSAIAVIFLAVFLTGVMGMFFWWDKFFARGLADLRPLFEWLPVVLIVLVSALSMRLWAEERRAGTLEILMTLPVPRWQLVVGKFLAGMVLIAVALALTLGLPITVSQMGHLDVGPVIGGYLAALLLSAAYLAIGMCVSAATDNQIVAFIGTAAVCAATYLVGYAGHGVGPLLGTGARFESVARGVLDLRDLAYYGGIVCIGIALNVVLLQRVTWSRGERGRSRRQAALLGVVLVVANAVALDLWLAPVRHARIDLTQGGTYSLSDSTHQILAGLDEELVIHGYFSEKTHPKLAPLVPQLRDLLEEYRLAGHGKVRVEIVDPTNSKDAKRDAKDRFGIDPRPLPFTTSSEQSVINAYFSIAVEYGDQHQVIGLDELIAVRPLDVGDVEVTLKNPEYQLTKTIKKTVSEFASVDTLFASTPGKIQLTAYVTPGMLPDDWKAGPANLQKVVDALTKQSGGKLAFTTVEPKTDDEMRELFTKYGVRPFQDPASGQVYYFQLVLQIGTRAVRLPLPQSLGEGELKASITEGLKRAAPGFTRVVGLWSPPAAPPMPAMQGMPPQDMPPPQTFKTLHQALAGNYEVRDVMLSAPVPDDVEALVLAGPASLDAKAVEYVDQFVMRGGALVVLAGRYRLSLAGGAGGIAVEKVTTGLEAAFQKWGITLGDDLVMDPKNDALPLPEEEDVGNGMMVREVHQLPYPFFVKVTGNQVSASSVITSGLVGAVMHWASPVGAQAKAGDDAHEVETLLSSSDGSWLTSSTEVGPDLRKYPDLGFPGPNPTDPKQKPGSQLLAVSVTGGFASAVAKPAAKQSTPDAGAAGRDKAAGRLLEHSPPDSRIVVFGSSAFASDLVQQLESDLSRADIELVHNAVDWSLADTDLLAIRSRSAASRALTVSPDSAAGWQIANIVIALIGLGLVVAIAWLRRRAVRPIALGKEA
ncbi:MAG TPA: Gldg family protein [Kofleriaceae bacterium]|jgi:ABC-2 type transport system permease protein|nr:Gldg family protein [Kofleriaceae bacterium]